MRRFFYCGLRGTILLVIFIGTYSPPPAWLPNGPRVLPEVRHNLGFNFLIDR
jgi:hypothetical protein